MFKTHCSAPIMSLMNRMDEVSWIENPVAGKTWLSFVRKFTNLVYVTSGFVQPVSSTIDSQVSNHKLNFNKTSFKKLTVKLKSAELNWLRANLILNIVLLKWTEILTTDKTKDETIMKLITETKMTWWNWMWHTDDVMNWRKEKQKWQTEGWLEKKNEN